MYLDANVGAALLGTILILIGVAMVVALYFTPTIVAVLRHNNNMLMIGVLNTFLGWTFLGWVVSLALAFSANSQAAVVNVYQSNNPSPSELPVTAAQR